MWKPVLITCLTILAIFGSVLGVNATVRGILSVLKSPAVEVVLSGGKIPSNQDADGIRLTAMQSMDGIADIRYYDLKNSFSLFQDIVTIRQDSGLTYYKIAESGIREVMFDSTPITAQYEHSGVLYTIAFDYGLLDGIVHFENTSDQTANSTYAVVVGTCWDDCVLIELGLQQADSYYVLYNVKTGAIQDFLVDIFGDTADRVSYVEISPSGSVLLIGASDDFYYLKNSRDVISVNQVSSVERIDGCTFITDDRISLWQRTDEAVPSAVPLYTVYTVDFQTNQITTVFANEPICQAQGNSTGFISLGRGVYIQKTEEQFILVDDTGEQYPIDGLDTTDHIEFLLSPDRRRVAIFAPSDDGTAGLSIHKLGILDLEKQTGSLFDRQDFDDRYETSVFWNTDSSLAVTAKKQEDYLYLYQFR